MKKFNVDERQRQETPLSSSRSVTRCFSLHWAGMAGINRELVGSGRCWRTSEGSSGGRRAARRARSLCSGGRSAKLESLLKREIVWRTRTRRRRAAMRESELHQILKSGAAPAVLRFRPPPASGPRWTQRRTPGAGGGGSFDRLKSSTIFRASRSSAAFKIVSQRRRRGRAGLVSST
jgi:hypothetical protein